MSNPHTSIFALSALGIFMLTDNALASVSVIGGQLVNDRNQVITLRVAAEPLAVDAAEAVAAVTREVTFDAPLSVQISPAGEEARQVDITATGLQFIVLDHGVFTVTQGERGFKIKAPQNKTGRVISDQINVVWIAPQIVAHKAINVSQNSAAGSAKFQTSPPPAKLFQAAASLADSTQSAQPSAIPVDYDAAIRKRTGDGSNAVRVILSSADVNVEEWVNPETAYGRLGVVAANATHEATRSAVRAYVDVVQSPR